jgi:PAS domain S-box-containing protein
VIATNEVDELAFDVEFMNCVLDKSDNLCVVDCDKHFSDFVGIHPSKIKQKKLLFHDLLVPKDREKIMRILCKKDSPHVYFDVHIKNKDSNFVFVHCTGNSMPNSTYCHLTIADVSRSVEKTEALREQAQEINHLIDLVTGGVCLFKVNSDMHFDVLYANEACCRYFGTTKENYNRQSYRIDELIHPDDKSFAFQAVGTAMATKKPIDTELRVMTHKDEFIWCKVNAGIQRYDEDKCPIFHAVFSDISRLKKAEEVADHQREMLVKTLKNVPGPIFCTDYDKPFSLNVVSKDFMKLTGFTRTELFEKYGGDLSALVPERERNIATNAIMKQAETQNVMKTTYSIRTKSGKYLVVVDRRKIIELDSGEKSMIGMLHDITSMHMEEDFDA